MSNWNWEAVRDLVDREVPLHYSGVVTVAGGQKHHVVERKIVGYNDDGIEMMIDGTRRTVVSWSTRNEAWRQSRLPSATQQQ